MNETILQKGTQIQDNRTKANYRIIFVSEKQIVLINMGSLNRCNIIPISSKVIQKQLQEQTYSIVSTNEDNTIVDEEKLPEPTLLKYKRNKYIIDAINNIYAPDYIGLTEKRRKPIIDELITKSKLTRAAIWRIIIKYLQSGCKESSLLHTRPAGNRKDKTTINKRGRVSLNEGYNGKNITDEDRKIMEKYMKKWLNNKLITLQKCYDDMVNEHYTTTKYQDETFIYEELPANQRPTIHQFKYYVREHTAKEDRLSAKMGKREFRNQRRVLTGTALKGVSGPGDIVEMDACELDIAVVAETDRTKTVGSPVAYFMIDIYSKLIIGASLSFDNNSILAMTNCLASLVENKAEILEKYGLTITPTNNGLTLEDVMPSGVKPRIIRVDHGADFTSKEKQRIANELSIEINYAPPGTGSLKSVVERSFRAFQKNFTDLTAHAGTKDYTNGHSNHNKEAKLTIKEVTYLMYSFILTYNSTQHDSMYDLTPDQVNNNIGRIPAELWRYGIQKIGNPAYISDKTQYLFSLMTPAKAKLKRTGIIYNKLRYIPDENDTETYDAMLQARTGSIPFSIRIDLRTISKIYYTGKNGKLYTAFLVDDINHRELANLTWKELETFREKEKKLLAEKRLESEATRRAHRRNDTEIVRAAKILTGKGKAEDKNMRENRTAEKARVAKELAFDKRFKLTKEAPKLQKPAINITPGNNDTNKATANGTVFEDTTNMTEEEKGIYRKKLNNTLITTDDDDIY